MVAFDIFSRVIMFTETKKASSSRLETLPAGNRSPGFPEKKKQQKNNRFVPLFPQSKIFSYLNWRCYISQTEGKDWTNDILLNFNPNK